MALLRSEHSNACWCSFFLLSSMLATITAVVSSSTSPSALNPFLSVRTKNGTAVTIYEAVPYSDGTADSISASTRRSSINKSYLFTPLAELQRSSAVRDFNSVTRRHEVRFDVQVWSDEYRDEIALLSRIPRDALSIYPADTVRLVSSGHGLNPARYTLPKNDVPFGAQPRTLQFVISCRERKDCGDLVAGIKGSEPNASSTEVVAAPDSSRKNALDFELEFRNASGADSVVLGVSVATHVVPTVTYRKIQQKGSDVLLTESDLELLAAEVAERFVAAGNQGVTAGLIEVPSPQDAFKAIRAGLIEGQADDLSVSDWNKLLWPEADVFYRPDMLVAFLNEAFKTDAGNASLFVVSKPFQELQALKIPKLDAQTRKILKSQVINWLKSTPGVDFVEWHRTTFRLKPSATLYLVNAASLLKRDKIASIRVDIYPPAAAQRFPITLSKDNVGQTTSTTAGSSSKKLGSPADRNALKALEDRFTQLQQDLQRQIDSLKLELQRVRPQDPNGVRTSGDSWPAGDYCLFFPRSLTPASGSSTYSCPNGFVLAHPQKVDLERAAQKIGRASGRNSNPWVTNFTCCRSLPRESPTSFNQI